MSNFAEKNSSVEAAKSIETTEAAVVEQKPTPVASEKPTARPVASRTSIYAKITNAAQQREADKAARAADRQKAREHAVAVPKASDGTGKSKRQTATLRYPTPIVRTSQSPTPPPQAEVHEPAEATTREIPVAALSEPTATPAVAELTATPSTNLATPSPVIHPPVVTPAKLAPMSQPPEATPAAPSEAVQVKAPAVAVAPQVIAPVQVVEEPPAPANVAPATAATPEIPTQAPTIIAKAPLEEPKQSAPVTTSAPMAGTTAPKPPPAVKIVPTTEAPKALPRQPRRPHQPGGSGGRSGNVQPPQPSARQQGGHANRPPQPARGNAPMSARPPGGQNRSGNVNTGNNRSSSNAGYSGRPRTPSSTPPPQGGSSSVSARPAMHGSNQPPRPIQPPPAGTAKPQTADDSARHRRGQPSKSRPNGTLSDLPRGSRPAKPIKVVSKPAPMPMVAKPAPPPKPVGPIEVPAITSVRELSSLLQISSGDLIKRLMGAGILATINQALDYVTAETIAEEFEIEIKPAVTTEKAEAAITPVQPAQPVEADQSKLESRPPVVTVLGHVDHGKTSLLDAIRQTKVAAGEAGGITQHIGAYQVEWQGRKLTFLDTPGHEAFTAMRARGAQVTDVAVLVVAADDGVMPQTKEAINHARAAKVPIIVALNKIDRETADPARVMRQLSEANVVVEEWGGDVPMVRVSAKQRKGIEELLEMILLVTDLAELKANPHRPATGAVIEAELDRSRGAVATLLVQSGTLRSGDWVVVNDVAGRIRAMFDEHGQRLETAGPSTPAVILGLPSVPRAGDAFQAVADERAAKALVQQVLDSQTQAAGRMAKALSLDELYAQMQAGKIKELNIILKADVQGSIEPIRSSLEKLNTDSLKVRILHTGTGNIAESDVSLALASQAIVIGFNTETDSAAKRLASNEGVDVRTYSIIYNLIEDVEKALKGLLEPKFKEVIDGHATVRVLFKVAKRGVAGSFVTDGKALRSGQVRLLRAGKAVFDGRVASLKRFTEDVREVNTNFECGIMLEGFEEVRQGDVIEFYHKEKETL